MANSKKRRKIIIFSIIGLVLMALTLVAVFKEKQPVITVQTEKVIRTNIIETVVANGKIQPVTQVVISPEVAGEIIALPVKEGDRVKKGDLLVQIKPDNYEASRNSAEANYKSALASIDLAQAELEKAETEYKRNRDLFQNKLVSDSVFLDFKTVYEVAKLHHQNAVHQADQAKFGLDKAKDDLSKTTITSPIDGIVSRLQSQLGERVLGTSFNMGTEIMTVADLTEMEARVDIGEVDVVLIAPGQKARLDVDSFKDRKFTGTVTQIANSSKSSSSSGSSSQSQEATKFEVRIRISEVEAFRPGMSVSTEIETRYRTNVLSVPMASVTTRPPKPPEKKDKPGKDTAKASGAKAAPASATNGALSATSTNSTGTNPASDKKSKEGTKTIEVVFVTDGNHVKMVPVKIGICDNDYWEISEGLTEGQEVVSGGYRAISKDLDDGKRIKRGTPDKVETKETK
ncbi:MAG: efflux RND transporter periplasmic adaptor subunit [Verrucomicrobiota bacterium]|jgi:HlyD family secretion protein